MSSLESSIDRLFQGPLDAFVAARTTLAKTLTGADAQRVKGLQKPTVVPWAVNQVYWHARPVYDRLLRSGGALRSMQIAVLEGRTADVRGAAEAHRTAVARAVAEALRIAASAGAHPDAEVLAQTFEAVSVATVQTDAAGRLTKPLRPAGFEALAGIAVKAPALALVAPPGSPERVKPTTSTPSAAQLAHNRMREREAAAAARRRRADVEKAERAVSRARAAEVAARAQWERRRDEVDVAEQELRRLRKA